MPPRKPIPRNDPRLRSGARKLGPDELFEQRALQWGRLSPAYRRRLERKGITIITYAQREIVGGLASARGHKTSARENAVRRLRRAEARGLPVWSDSYGYGFTVDALDGVAETYGRQGQPDYETAATVIITRAESEQEYIDTGRQPLNSLRKGTAASRLRIYWVAQPPAAPDFWYYYHP